MFGGETYHVYVKVDHAGHGIAYAARKRTLNIDLKKLSWGTGIRSFSSFSLAL